MKDAVIAKLSSQCEELYVEVLKLFQKELLRPLWDKEWIPTVSIFTGIIVSPTECWCLYFSL
jgi:BRO1-like domain.